MFMNKNEKLTTTPSNQLQYLLSTCLPVGIEIVPHFCVSWGEAEGCTVVRQGGTISMPTGRQKDNDFIPGLKTKTNF